MDSPKLPAEKNFSIPLSDVEVGYIIHCLDGINADIDKNIASIQHAMVGQVSYETQMEYYIKRKRLNAYVIDKLKQTTL